MGKHGKNFPYSASEGPDNKWVVIYSATDALTTSEQSQGTMLNDLQYGLLNTNFGSLCVICMMWAFLLNFLSRGWCEQVTLIHLERKQLRPGSRKSLQLLAKESLQILLFTF